MGIKLFLAVITIMLALMVVPLFNEVLSDLIENQIILKNSWMGSDYRTAFWRFFPIIIGGYLLVILPIQILTRGHFPRRGDNQNK